MDLALSSVVLRCQSQNFVCSSESNKASLGVIFRLGAQSSLGDGAVWPALCGSLSIPSGRWHIWQN